MTTVTRVKRDNLGQSSAGPVPAIICLPPRGEAILVRILAWRTDVIAKKTPEKPARAADRMISIAEASRIMECSKSWVLVLLQNGELAGEKLHARAWLVSERSARENLASYREATAGRRRVGRPRADNPPSAGGRGDGVSITSPAMNLQTPAGPLDISDLVTTKTASAESGFHRSWIYGMVQAGKLTPVEIDGVQFLRRSQLATLERSNRGRPRKTVQEAAAAVSRPRKRR